MEEVEEKEEEEGLRREERREKPSAKKTPPTQRWMASSYRPWDCRMSPCSQSREEEGSWVRVGWVGGWVDG